MITTAMMDWLPLEGENNNLWRDRKRDKEERNKEKGDQEKGDIEIPGKERH